MQLSANTPAGREILTVSQLNRRVRQLLETHFPLLWVEGELSNLANPSSGHWYFTLKDSTAQVRCAMFRNRNQLVRFRPENGMQVLIRCRLSLYENRGDYQLIAEHMEPAGLGALQRRFEALKAQLEAEGLFAEQHKQPLPAYPRRIGVITSPTGAAVRDIVHVLGRRYPLAEVLIYPVSVQGAGAAPQIVEALGWADRDPCCDVLILARGGGSLEDLWAFNEESVARAIFQCALPLVSGVGHETDFTIADFVADMRAPTPSAAAELVSPDSAELLATFAGYQTWFRRAIRARLESAANRLNAVRKRLRSPAAQLRDRAQHLDHLEIRLRNRIHGVMENRRQQVRQLEKRLWNQRPDRAIGMGRDRVLNLEKRLRQQIAHRLREARQRLGRATALLQAVSPLEILNRGFAIPRTGTGAVLHSVAEVSEGSSIQLLMRDGELACTIESVKPGGPEKWRVTSGKNDEH